LRNSAWTSFAYRRKVRAIATPVKLRGRGTDRRVALVRTFEAICQNGPLPRGALRSSLGASPSTITAAVQDLRSRGLVAESGIGASTGGRRPRILDLAPDIGVVLVVDIGAINLRVGVANLRGSILASKTIPTPTSSDPEHLRTALVSGLAAMRDEMPGRVHAIGVAVAAVVNPDSDEISLATNIPGWRDVDLHDWLEDFGAPVLVDNEANLAAVGEYAQIEEERPMTVLFLAIGAGIGAGLILNGELFRGATGAAGEIGYLRVPSGDGTVELEREAGAAAVVRRYRDHGGDAPRPTAESVFALAAAGDRAAAAAVGEVVDRLALGIANAIVTVDPRVVVLGGGLGAAGGVLLEPLRERIAGLVPVIPEMRPSALGPVAALAGAAWWAAQNARQAIEIELERASVLG
jgi:predicted NBD/HSP70 family sugar kinase